MDKFNKAVPICKVKYLFLNLLKFTQPKLILDVGSMDGSDSLRFRKMCPEAKILAFEANPYNYGKMLENTALTQSRIEVFNHLVSNDTQSEFYITKDSAKGVGNLGSSSMRAPLNTELVQEKITPKTASLKQIISKYSSSADSIAMWVDVEGAAYEVLESARGCNTQISLLHVEVETVERWKDQKLKDDVVQLCTEFGLVLAAQSDNPTQQDLVFVRGNLLKENPNIFRSAFLLTKFLGPSSSRILERF